MPLTVHAGELGLAPTYADAPPELIVEAIEALGARRIGHGASLAGSAEARAFVRSLGVGVECCPVSNDKMGFVPIVAHPLPQFVAEGLLVSLNTDDPLMFGPFTVSETIEVFADQLGLNEADLLALAGNGIDTAFVSEERRALLRARLAAGCPVRPEHS